MQQEFRAFLPEKEEILRRLKSVEMGLLEFPHNEELVERIIQGVAQRAGDELNTRGVLMLFVMQIYQATEAYGENSLSIQHALFPSIKPWICALFADNQEFIEAAVADLEGLLESMRNR